ncbi:F-box family protein [Rhynchospora pubera]|uniref:F-box family protein n=1 Tax=Rhynchospora pubera TaxID=906938 RepID=A0AAV8EVY9_9POAL|nr:F-box family protein [Rhynchospora pubera]
MDGDHHQFPAEKRLKPADAGDLEVLPDEILTLVLSSLTTKQAVQSVAPINKKFGRLSSSAPSVHFDVKEFLPPPETLENLRQSGGSISEYEKNFSAFVNCVFRKRKDGDIDQFKLLWDEEDGNPTPATGWLCKVAHHNPKSLYLYVSSLDSPWAVPDPVFTIASLQKLVLYLATDVEFSPTAVNFPCLKTLNLGSVTIGNGVMELILLGSPVVEEMVLEDCNLKFSLISSSTLKTLEIDEGEISAKTLTISIPSLEYLKVRSCEVERLKFENLDSLVRAEILVDGLADESKSVDLTGLSSVTALKLELSGDAWDIENALAEETTQFPVFHNLQTLIVGEGCMTDKLDRVASFLQHAPNLKKLVLLHLEPSEDSKIEISLVLGDDLDVVDTTEQEKDESAIKVVEDIKALFRTIRGGPSRLAFEPQASSSSGCADF